MTESASQAAAAPTRLASSPFDKPEADIVLRSADGVDFCVRSHILVEASPVFESILSIPQPPSDRRPVVDLAEDQKTLDTILRICYPIVKVKSVLPLEEVERAVKAALKYEMELALSVLTDELLQLAEASPLEVWAIGCRTGLERVARHAATEALSKDRPSGNPLHIPVRHLEGVSAGDYFRLLEFHRQGGKVDDDFRLLTATSAKAPTEEARPAAHSPTPFDVPHPDLVCTSSDGVDVPVHKASLATTSPLLREQIDEATTFTPAGLPILRFSEDAGVLVGLLGLCYPGEDQSDLPSCPSEFVNILLALDKYKMSHMHAAALPRWEDIAKVSPIAAYFAAARARLRSCAEAAAKHSLHAPLEGRYVADMECSLAVAYHHLLAYHASCRAVAKRLLGSLSTVKPNSKCDSDKACVCDSRAKVVYQRAPVTSSARRTAEVDYNAAAAATSKSQDAWFNSFADKLANKVDAGHCLTGDLPPDPTAFEAASAAGQWCSSCSAFADKLAAADAAVCLIPSRVAEVTIAF